MKVASGNVLWRQRKRNWCRTPFTFTVYTLTDRELSVKTGILNERFNLIKLFRIVDISVERTFLQRIFGMSTLVLDTRDQSSGNGVVALKNVINGFEVRQVLQEAVDASRKRMACPLVSSSEDRVDGNLVLVQMVWMSTVLMRVPMRTVSKL